MANYTYPHVNFTTRAKLRRTPAAEVSTATTLLAPFTCDRGPENELVAIDSMSTFKATFGNLEYSNPDQRQILYIGEWLRSGGRVLACRLTGGNVTKSTANVEVVDSKDANKKYTVTAYAKYTGTYYNNITIKIEAAKSSSTLLNITVIDKSSSKEQTVELFRNKKITDFDNVCENSEYIGKLYVQDDEDNYVETDIENFARKDGITLSLSGGTNVAAKYLFGNDTTNEKETTCSSELVTKLKTILAQPLTTPFDVMIDCGYCELVKKALVEFFTTVRTDAFLYLSNYVILGNGRVNNNTNIKMITSIVKTSGHNNIALSDYYEKVTDLYSTNTAGYEVYVPTTYFIAGLLPSNDATNGCQWPLAGKTRGVIKNCKWINTLPTNDEKQEHYEKQLNYIEADTDGKFIMTQLTLEADDTALKFINNSRSLLKMKKELTVLARNYLHEFNDRITRNNLKQTLESYLNSWIQNRTISKGSIEIQDYTDNDTLTNEELQILVDIKFAGTIEIISFDITVE